MKKQNFVHGRVSAVIPVYNGAQYISFLIESILEQTYPHMEIILVDDGSTDNTVQVAESYRADFMIRGYDYHIIKAEHKNASAAINCGLVHVTGEYLIWPDSDDILEKESVKKRVDFLEGHPQYQCVRSLAYYYNAKTGERVQPDEKTGDLTKEDLFWDILESKTYICCGCYMLKSESFFEIYPERCIPEYNVGQNFQMLLPFMFRYKCPTIQEQLYGVCVREGSHSRRELTQEEEEKKYCDFERLIDDIVIICCIDDKKSKKRINSWKEERRYWLAKKYGYKNFFRLMIWQIKYENHFSFLLRRILILERKLQNFLSGKIIKN